MAWSFNYNESLFSFEDYCTDYGDEIIWVLQETELNRLTMRYTSPQLQYREVMVNLVRTIGEMEKFRRTTVHLAIYLMDAFMDNHNITENRLNLLALCCIQLASKIEENEPKIPSLVHLNNLVRQQYPMSDYTVLEILLLKFFNWHLIIPTTAVFVEYWILNIVSTVDFITPMSEQQLFERRSRAIDLALEFLDITLTDIKMTNIRPSLLAAACMCAARSSIKVISMWNDNMNELTGYSIKEIDGLTRQLMNWRARLITQRLYQKRTATDSGYSTEINDSFSSSADNSDEDVSVTGGETNHDEEVFAFKIKRAR